MGETERLENDFAHFVAHFYQEDAFLVEGQHESRAVGHGVFHLCTAQCVDGYRRAGSGAFDNDGVGGGVNGRCAVAFNAFDGRR